MEPHHHSTGMLLLRHSRRNLCRLGKIAGANEQGDGRNSSSYDPSWVSTTVSLRLGDIARIDRKHLRISFAGDGRRGLNACCSPDRSYTADIGRPDRAIEAIKEHGLLASDERSERLARMDKALDKSSRHTQMPGHKLSDFWSAFAHDTE
jgi:hypothetical protein